MWNTHIYNQILCIVFSPLNSRTGTCFHNLLNQLPIDEANVWNYCQLFTTTNNAALSTIVGSKSRNISNLEILPNALKKNFILPPSPWECLFPYHPIKTSSSASVKCSLACLPFVWPAPSQSFFYLHWILSPLLFSLNMFSFRTQISHNIIWGQRVNCMKAFFSERW